MGLLAEMAVVRLAKLEDLESLTALAHGIVPEACGPAPAAAPARAQPAPREKKTTDRMAQAPERGEARGAPVDRTSAEPTPAVPVAAVPEPVSLGDARAVWLQACEAVGGLATDFGAEVETARWNDQVLEVVLPGTAPTALAFLRRPEVAAGINRMLTDLSGRPVRHAVSVAAVEADGASASSRMERPRTVASQAALLREVMDHPLVAQARTLFDAAVRTVEPARPLDPTRQAPAAAAPTTAAVAADGQEEETDG